MRSAAAGRGLALAISFLLLCIAGGEAGHALAGLEGHGLGSAFPVMNASCGASGSVQPHDSTNCLLCRAARVSSTILSASAAGAPPVAELCGALSQPETLSPSTPRRGTEAARAPPVRLSV